MKSASIPKWGQTEDLYRHTLRNFKHLNHKDSNGWIWFGFDFVFKLPDPKINKICASETEKAALLKHISKNPKTPFSSCNKQLAFSKGKGKNLDIYFI